MAVRFSADGQAYTRALSLGVQTQWALACWAKISVDRNVTSTIWSLGSNSVFDAFTLETDSDGTTAAVLDYEAEQETGTRALTAGTWYYWAVLVNGTSGTVLSRAAGDSSFTVSTWTGGNAGLTLTNLYLGNRFGSDWLNGALAAVKLWSGAALSQAELEAEAWSYLPRRTANLAAWYPLTRAETVDYSGAGRTLSGGSGAATEDGPPIPWRQGRPRRLTPLSVPAEATPGTIAAPWSMPAPGVATGVTEHPSVIAAPWAMLAPEVFTGDPVTPVEAGLLSAPWSMPSPSVQAFKNATVAAPLIAAPWSMPAPAVSVPVNAGDDLDGPGQLSFNGFKLGSGTRYPFIQLDGASVDLPALDNGNVPHPTADGSISGQKLPQSRIITLTTRIRAPRDQIEQAALDFLNGLPAAEADEELPLAIRIMDTIYVGRGAVIRRAAPIDKRFRLGRVEAVVQWELSDPRLYSRALHSATIPDGSAVDVFNAGNRKTRPLVRVPGPAHGPSLTSEQILGDGRSILRVIEFDLEVAAGETLIIDPEHNTATIGGSSKVRYLTGASLAVGSWVLGRGATTIEYATQEGGAPPVTVLWRDAWI
ncbi:hypothetical protein Skr01_36200 [Sphaerisporangium krabiense]|uniref:Uncharacterized protein n=1 Tax=Sphaerisporangium krabiense TaxID=763782 RepID=A0A7W8Z363_9ACTN|nr:LamG-like jellyroll fold domain-containing protein [Sphaerisporangium krabiense]MBB5626613.1 hypothetical protein [Sphaerisporangium krabiense]GII63535.1 hypothetical protein Skr01_36200 [Sphaerisporangium krabiense]